MPQHSNLPLIKKDAPLRNDRGEALNARGETLLEALMRLNADKAAKEELRLSAPVTLDPISVTACPPGTRTVNQGTRSERCEPFVSRARRAPRFVPQSQRPPQRGLNVGLILAVLLGGLVTVGVFAVNARG